MARPTIANAQAAGERRAQCEGKAKFETAALALRIAKRRRGKGKSSQAYRCPFCAAYHLGAPI